MTNYLEPRIAAELRAELARQGYSRHWLAEQIGKPVTTVARWLRGPQSPGLNDLDAICQALGMSIGDLLSAVERNGGYVMRPAGSRPPIDGPDDAANSRETGRDSHRYAKAA